MASWHDVEREAPDFAAAARARFDAHAHKLLATLRADGSPRLSGIEVTFFDGEVLLGMMPGSQKALDLRRDPRLALHSSSQDPADADTWLGDAKLSGRAVEITDPAERRKINRAMGGPPADGPDSAHLFRIDITEVVRVFVGDPPDHLVIELWRPGEELHRTERR